MNTMFIISNESTRPIGSFSIDLKRSFKVWYTFTCIFAHVANSVKVKFGAPNREKKNICQKYASKALALHTRQ